MSQQAVRRRSPIRLPGRQVQLAWRALNSLMFLCASSSLCRVYSSRKAAFGDCRIIQTPASRRLPIDRIRAQGDSALNRAASSAITSESEGNLIGKSMRLVSGSVDSSPGMIAGFELLARPESERFDQETGGPRQRVPISARSVVRPKGPAVLPARVEGPGGCHHHPVRPNGPTVPRTARAARGIVGPLGRHMSWSVLPGPLGRAGRTAGPLGRQTPAARPPAPQPTPAGSQRVAGGREQRPPPVTPPPKTPAPRSGCQKARLNRTVPGHQRVPPHLHHDAALLDPEAGMTSIRTTSLRQRRSTPVSRFAGPTWPRSTPSFGLRRWG